MIHSIQVQVDPLGLHRIRKACRRSHIQAQLILDLAPVKAVAEQDPVLRLPHSEQICGV